MARDGADALPGDVPGPAGREPGRQGAEGRHVAAGGGRHQAVRHRSPPHRRRRALRRRRRHGDEARRAVGGDRGGRRVAGTARRRCCCRRAARRSARRAGGSWRRVRAWCCCAGASRASTSASSRPTALEEISVGDFVLSGGEIAAMALIDSCVRLLPGVMGAAAVGERGEFRGRPAGIPALHPARDLDRARRNRTARAGGAALGPSRQGRRLADDGSGKRSRGGGGPICGPRRRTAPANEEK